MAAPIHAQRWLMTAPKAPLVLEAFDASPGAGEVAVSVAGCGVCHTDLGYFYDGVRTNHALPLALGHEVSGRVVAAGAGAQDWLGKAVIVPAVLPCGECDLCQRGLGTICRKQKMPGNDIQGGFASHIVVPARGLCPVDEQRLAAAGLELGEVSVVADALTTPYQAVQARRRGAGRARRGHRCGRGGRLLRAGGERLRRQGRRDRRRRRQARGDEALRRKPDAQCQEPRAQGAQGGDRRLRQAERPAPDRVVHFRVLAEAPPARSPPGGCWFTAPR